MLLATAATESNFQNAFKSFGIEASPVAFDILSSRLYSNTTLAIVREILSNAYDAMAEAGTLESKKIKVHFPDMMESRFIVRDYGNGLSEEEVFNLYTTFFKSTKRDSNEFTGCYGLGSKSPFAYGDSFMVESFQNGTSKKYLMAKMNGYPKVTKIGEKETAEDNGLKITIPVPEGDKDFYYEFCKYVKYQPDLGKVIEANADVEYVEFFKEYEDSLCKVRLAMESNGPYRNSCSYIKQGMNIFQWKEDISLYGFTAVVEVPIGTFEIVPSRESLSESESNKRNFIRIKNSVQKLMSNILNEFEPHSTFVFNSYLHEPIAEALRKKYFPTKSFISTYTYYRNSSSIDVQKSYRDRSMYKIAYTGYIAGLFEIKSYAKDYFSLSESCVRDDIPMIIVVGNENDPDWSKVKRKMSTYPDFRDMNIYVKGFSYDHWINHPNSSEYPICAHTLTRGVPCAEVMPKDAIEYLKNIVWTYNSISELNFDIQIMPIKTFLKKFKSSSVKRKAPSAPVNTLVGVIEMSNCNDPSPIYFRDSTLEKQVESWNVIGVALKKECPHFEDLKVVTFLFNRKITNSNGNIAVDEALANQGINVRGIDDSNSKHHVLLLSSRGYKQALDMGLKPLDFNKLIEDVKAMNISMYIKSHAIDISELNFISKLFTEDHEIRKHRGIKLHLNLIRMLKNSHIYKMHEIYLSLAEKIDRNSLDNLYGTITNSIRSFFKDSSMVKICEYKNIALLPRLAKFYSYFSERRRSYMFPSKEDQYRIANFILNNKNHL